MMQVWHFSEMAYHPAWPHLSDTYRVFAGAAVSAAVPAAV